MKSLIVLTRDDNPIAIITTKKALKRWMEINRYEFTSWTIAGEDQYGLSRNDIHNKRIQIRSMARQFGMKATEYPINLIGGTYTEED